MKTLIAAAFTVLLAACGGGSNLSLSVRAGSSTATTARRALTLSNGIVLSRVRIVVRSIKLELDRSADAGSGEMEEHEMSAGPFLLDLSGATLDGTPAKLLDASLPAGTYREIRFRIHKPASAEAGVSTNAGIQAMATANASIVADGTIDGASFTFSTGLEVDQQLEGNFALAAGSNLTLNVDPATWFGGTGAARLDPRDAASASQIESNIKRSFKAFRDDDHDGHED